MKLEAMARHDLNDEPSADRGNDDSSNQQDSNDTRLMGISQVARSNPAYLWSWTLSSSISLNAVDLRASLTDS